MNATRLPALIAALFFGLLGDAQAAECQLPAGRITKIAADSKARIIDRNAKSRHALYGGLLFAKDRFEFEGAESITAIVHGKRHVFKPGEPMSEIPERDTGSCSESDGTYLDAYRALLSRPRLAIAVYTVARGGVPVTTQPPLQIDTLVPAGSQWIPKGFSRIGLIWRGGPAEVHVNVGLTRDEIVSSGNESWVLINLPEGTGPFLITVPGQTLAWTVQRGPKAPTPPWFKSQEATSEAQRLVRAAWLLKDGPPEWHAFALSELAELAETGNFVADQLWTGARSGELMPEAMR